MIIKGLEVTIVGVTFIVNYRFTAGLPATEINPAEPPEVDILRAEIKGQPNGDADTLLVAIKINPIADVKFGILYNDGYDLLQYKLLQGHQQ